MGVKSLVCPSKPCKITLWRDPRKLLGYLVAPYRAILRYYRCDTPYRAILFQGVSTPPKWCDTPPLVLSFTQAHLRDTPFCNVSRDNCAIPHENRHERVLRYYRYKYRAIWKVSLLGLLAGISRKFSVPKKFENKMFIFSFWPLSIWIRIPKCDCLGAQCKHYMRTSSHHFGYMAYLANNRSYLTAAGSVEKLRVCCSTGVHQLEHLENSAKELARSFYLVKSSGLPCSGSPLISGEVL